VVAALGLGGCAREPGIVRSAATPDFHVRAPADAAAFPMRTVQVGRSVSGTPMTVEIFGEGPHPILILGGIHGNEPASAAVASRLATILREDPTAVRGTTVAILIAANPDGLARTVRSNSNGVDLNRNFPAKNWRLGTKGKWDFGGTSPASEPETQAILTAIDLVRPDRIISLHVTAGGPPVNNYDGPAEAWARRIAAENGYEVTDSPGYPTPGSLGSWAGVERGLPMVTIEMPGNLSAERCWLANRAALLAAIRVMESPAAKPPLPLVPKPQP